MSNESQLSQLADMNQLLSNLKKLKELKQKHKRKRSCSVREINRTRNIHGYYKVTFVKMKEVDPDQFFIHTRMSKDIFDMLLGLVRPQLETSEKVRINTECRLALTLL